MEWLQNLWAEYGPVITAVLGSGLGAATVAFLSNFAAKVAANKVTGTLDVNKIVAEVTEKVTEKVTQNVVKSITGSVLDVDISAVVEEKLNETLGNITVQVKDVKQAVESMKECSALTAKALGKSKLLDKTEQAALVAEAEKLSESVTRETKPVTKVKLTAAPEAKAPAATQGTDILKL